jgi:hypothetical protein
MDRTNLLVIGPDSPVEMQLMHAVHQGDVGLTRSLLGSNADPNVHSDTLGFAATPLIVAAALGSVEVRPHCGTPCGPLGLPLVACPPPTLP